MSEGVARRRDGLSVAAGAFAISFAAIFVKQITREGMAPTAVGGPSQVDISRVIPRDASSYPFPNGRALPLEESILAGPVTLPPILARLACLLPDFDYDRIFCDDDTRLVIMVMSVTLIGVAFGLYWRAPPHPGNVE